MRKLAGLLGSAALRIVTPQTIDLAIALSGLALLSFGAGLAFRPAGFMVGGIGLMYLGLWHR